MINQRIHKNGILDVLDKRLKYIFPAPAILVIGLLMIYPLVYLFLLSIRDYPLSLTRFSYVGFQWFARIVTDSRFWMATWRTAYYTIASVVAEMILGTIMALILNRDFRGISIVRTLFLLPMIATPAASILIWKTMFNPSLGVLNWFLEVFGLGRSLWLASEITVIPSLVIVEVWWGSPFVMLIVLAGLKNMPLDPFECASIDGASAWQRFIFLAVPMIRPALVMAALFRLIDTLKQFPFIWILTEGGPNQASETLYIYGYKLAFQYFELGYGASVLFSLLVLIFVVSITVMRARERSWV